MVCTTIKDLKNIKKDMEGIKVMAKRFINIISEKLESIENEDIDIIIETKLPLIRTKKQKILAGEKNLVVLKPKLQVQQCEYA